MTKRVLMISWYFYPCNRTAVHRPAGFARHLPKFGWEPTVLCIDWSRDDSTDIPRWHNDPALAGADPCKVVRVPYDTTQGRRRFTNPVLLLAASWWSMMPWKPLYPPAGYTALLNAARQRLEQGQFDVIWATSPPPVPHAVAATLSGAYGIPWVADLRDIPDELASGLPFPLSLPELIARVRRVRAEIATCSAARALVTVSQPLADRLASRHRAPVFVIPNAFEPDMFQQRRGHHADEFTIVYCGTFLAGLREPGILLDALDVLAREGHNAFPKLSVRFYGPHAAFLRKRLRGRPCAKFVTVGPVVSHHEAIRMEQEACVLLFVSTVKGKGIMTSKVFEYLGAGRPILAVPGDGDVTDAVIRETGAGVIARSVPEVISALTAWYREWEQTGTVRYAGNAAVIGQYTREKQTARLAQIFDEICRTGPR